MSSPFVYEVLKLNNPLKIDGDWHKLEWQKCLPAGITNYMGTIPSFFPKARFKMMYDEENLYLIFLVKDRFVRCITKEINGNVWEDACVEFFFSPDNNFPERYINLEINCGGTALMHYNKVAGKEITVINKKDIQTIEIAHSLPKIINPEIHDEVTWTVEYRIPLNLIKKYSNLTQPEPGISWKANFYKIAENSSNRHYLTWSSVYNHQPDFHLPKYFGELKFL